MTPGEREAPSAPANPASWADGELLGSGRRAAPPTRKIEAALATALAVLLAVGFYSYQAIRFFGDVAALRSRVSQTSNALDDVLSLIKEAESGQRGYLITADAQYLEPYESARRAMESRIAKLRRLATEDGVATDRLDRISDLIDAKFLELAETIGLRRQLGLEAAAVVVQTDRGQQIMDEIGNLVADIRSENLQRLTSRNAELDRQVRRAKIFTLFGSTVSFAYVFAAAMVIRRDFRRRTRRQEDLFRRLIETAEAIILVRDLDGRITLYNPYTERILGYPLSEMRGKDWFSTFVPEMEQERMREMFSRVLREGEAKGYVSSLLARDRTVRVVNWHTQVLRDGVGALVGMLSTGQDITAQRAAQKLAEESGRLADIGAITAKIAHDVGNPLFALSLQVQMILRNVQRDGEQPLRTVAQPLELLASAVRRLEAMIRDILAFAREQRLERDTIDVSGLLDDVVRLWHPAASARHIALRTEICQPLVPLEADGSKLHRVLDNLVKNALEAIGDGPGEVKLSAAVSDSARLRISVEDSGPGIADDVEVFRLFETTKKDGTGLGLAVSKQIMLAHGGDLSFARREPHGTVFHMELPLHPA